MKRLVLVVSKVDWTTAVDFVVKPQPSTIRHNAGLATDQIETDPIVMTEM